MTNKTTEIVFALPQDFDPTLAEEGVWFPYADDHDFYYGEFLLAHIDDDSSRIKLAQERLRTKFAKEIRLKTITLEQLGLEMFLDVVLKGWKDVKAPDGSEVKFSPEAARLYFSQRKPKKAVRALLDFAGDERNYYPATKDEIAGN